MKPIAIVAIAIASFVFLLIVAGIVMFFSISADRFDCESTRKRACSDDCLKRALLPDAYLRRLFTLICRASDAFDASGMPYMAIGGTLLSAMRGEGALIPWDDDADVGVFESAWNDADRKDVFREELRARGLRLVDAHPFGIITERIVFAENDPLLDAQPFMDVFVYKRRKNSNELHYNNTVARARFPRDATSVQRVFPLQTASLRYGDEQCEISVPAKAEQMLTKIYGDRWRSQFVVATHRDGTMVAPCTLSDEQAIALGLL